MNALSPETPPASNGDRSEGALDENRRLRRTMRDLVALSVLPAAWSGLHRDHIARSVCDALLHMLSLDSICLSLTDSVGPGGVEVLSGKHRDARYDEATRALFASLRESQGGELATIELSQGLGTLHGAVVRFGIGAAQGVLLACSHRSDFPTEQERLLLGVGVNQMAIVTRRSEAEDQLREQTEWLRVTLASLGDAVIAADIDGRVSFLNAAAEQLTGWPQTEACGMTLDSVCRMIDEAGRQPMDISIDRVRHVGRIVGPANQTLLVTRSSGEIPVDYSVAPIRNPAGDVMGTVIVFRGASARRKTEQLRNARLALTQVLNEAPTIATASLGVLAALGESFAWDCGLFWIADSGTERLTCHARWHKPDSPAAHFVAASSERSFARGEGLPGRVWARGKHIWIADLLRDPNFPRAALAARHGLHCGFAWPVVVGERTLGVIEFFTQRTYELDADLLEMMGTALNHVGQFFERKTALDDLRRSEMELAEFFENATVGLHWVGPDGKILRVNRAELDLLGYEREEYLGRHIADFHEDPDVVRDILARLNAGQTLVDHPARLRCKDGGVKDVLIDSSVLWEEGRFVHTRCFTRDVTARRQAETAFADARRRLDAALEAGAISTWTWDIPSNLIFADGVMAQLFDLSPSSENGRPLTDYLPAIHPDDLGRIMAALDHSVASGELYEADYRIVRADGAVRWVTARGRPEHDAVGRPLRMPGVLVDITERKLLEEALRDADLRKDEFLATLAHELRNPLAPIRNALEILKLPQIGASTLQQTRAMMERQVHHLIRLVDDLMDVSRVMRGKIELRKEPVELASVISRAVETVQPLIETQGHLLDLALPHEALRVDADPVRLVQVISNLLTNSAKYTEAHGHLRLSVEREPGGVAAIRVCDNGIGIAPELLPRIFELFVQADHAPTKAQGGLGIGLTLTKNLVQMHGGTIEALSAGLGRGSEFVVRLPLIATPSNTSQDPVATSPALRASSTGHRLLVVDDNRDAALSLAMLLRMLGHEVRVAHDGSTALAMAATYLPHAVFLDLGMPGMDGYEVAHRLRGQPGMEGVVLAALTGWGLEKDRRRTAEAGFDLHLVKPLEAKSLDSLLQAVADRVRAQNADGSSTAGEIELCGGAADGAVSAMVRERPPA